MLAIWCAMIFLFTHIISLYMHATHLFLIQNIL